MAQTNVKTDPSKLPESNDPDAIRKQVEFYFSDENLPTDKFLWRTSQANNGWVPIKTIHNFKRMRRFQPEQAVIDALKESELLEVEDDKVRRKVPLAEPNSEEKQKAFESSVYAKGFGPETETSQFDIEAFFEKFGPTKQVRLRRQDDGTFKGSVFVEFADLEHAKKFLEDKHKYNDEELLTMSKQAYVEMKAAEHGFDSRANGKRRRFNAFKEKKRSQPKGRGNQKRRRNDHSDEEPQAKKNKDDAKPSPDPAEESTATEKEADKPAETEQE